MLSAAVFFFFNDTATTEIYTLSLHDALPILEAAEAVCSGGGIEEDRVLDLLGELVYKSLVVTGASTGVAVRYRMLEDRKSTRLNSSHANISYAVFCLKKKKKSSLY